VNGPRAMASGAPVFGLALLLCLCMGLMTYAHVRWDQGLAAAITARDNLAQSRRYAVLAQLDTERLLAGQTSIPRTRVLAHLDRALTVARDLRKGSGAIAGFSAQTPIPGDLAAAVDAYVAALADARALMERQLDGFEAGGSALLVAQRAIDARVVAVEETLLRHLASQRATLKRHDAITLGLVAVLGLVVLGFLYVAHRRRDLAVGALLASESRLRAFADSLPEIAFLMDRNGRYLESFGSASALLAAPPDTLVGRTLDEVFPAETSSRFLAVIRQALARQRTQSYEYALHLDGREYFFDARVSPVPGSDRVVWASWDVTARRRAEAHARALTRLYNFLSQVNQTIVWAASEDDLFERICRVAIEFGGYRMAWLMRLNDRDQPVLQASAGGAVADRALLSGQASVGRTSLTARVLRDGRLLRLGGLAGDDAWIPAARAAGLDGYVGLPLQLDGDTVAVLCLLAPEVDPDDEDEARLLEEVIMDLSFALRRLRDERERASAEQSARLLAAALRSTRDGVLLIDLAGVVVSANEAFCEQTGLDESALVGRALTEQAVFEGAAALFADIDRALRDGDAWQGEVSARRAGGEPWSGWLSCASVRDDDGQPTHRVLVLTDISQARRAEAELQHLSQYDPLTDLPNRVLIRARLVHAIELAQRRGTRVAVLFLDLDNFKTINDGLGHAAGDEVLAAVAHRLRARLRRQDTLGRQGSDEFVLVLEGVDAPAEAAVVAQGVFDSLASPVRLASGQDIYLQASMGISLYPDNGHDADDLIRDADAAMYQAKLGGRNALRFYSDEYTHAANQRLSLETGLRRALESELFELRYQPLIDLASDRLIGAEVLVRLSPAAGLGSSPAEFIPIMEANGLIVPLGDFVRSQALRQGRAWLDAGLPPLTLAINLSVTEIRRGGLEQRIAQQLAESGYPVSLLELEITESGAMEQGERAQQFLEVIGSLGLRLAIDDFGTGYSSLAYLKRLPVHKLKIDRSFVCDLPDDASAVELVDTIITLGHQLGLSVLAEGVETVGQRDLLRARGCNACQGYLYAPALSAEEFERRFLRSASAG
jgi:diguanylate cyclase (GGDEF)-like protein/PAS domain S-box-containing protein